MTEVLPKLNPATNAIKTVIDLAAWLKDNAVEVAGLVEQFAAQLSRIAAGDPASIQLAGEGIRTGLQKATPAVIELVIKLAAGKVDQKIDKLTDKIRGVGDKIKDKLGGLIDKFAGAAVKRLSKYWPKVPGGDLDNDYKGLASKVESWKADEGDKQPHEHRLWATVRNGKAQLWLASTPEELEKVLKGWEEEVKDLPNGKGKDAVKDALADVRKILFTDPPGDLKKVLGTSSELNDVRKAVTDLDADLRACGNKPKTLSPALRKKLKEAIKLTRQEKQQLNTRLEELDTHLKVIQEGFAKACFMAGTPLLVPGGVKAIEEFRVGDPLLSRDEWDIGGEVSVQYVEEVFHRTGRLLRVRAGGRDIGTTAEHPFWVVGKGWTRALEVQPGDQLVGHDGQRVAVEGVSDTGETVPVYNLRVSRHHTYFVGCAEWGWNAWAHNAYQTLFTAGDSIPLSSNARTNYWRPFAPIPGTRDPLPEPTSGPRNIVLRVINEIRSYLGAFSEMSVTCVAIVNRGNRREVWVSGNGETSYIEPVRRRAIFHSLATQGINPATTPVYRVVNATRGSSPRLNDAERHILREIARLRQGQENVVLQAIGSSLRVCETCESELRRTGRTEAISVPTGSGRYLTSPIGWTERF